MQKVCHKKPKLDHYIKEFFEHLWIGIQKIDVEGFKGFLVAGPVFMPPLEENVNAFETKRINEFIDKILRGINNNSIDKKESLILAFRRPWCHKNDFHDVLVKSAKAIESILDCKIPSEFVLQRYICRYLAFTARVLYSRNLENEIIRLSYSGQHDLDSVLNNIELNFPTPIHDEKGLSIYAVWRDKKWSLEVKEEKSDFSIKLNLEEKWRFFKSFNQIPCGFLINPDKQASDGNNDPIKRAEESVKSLYHGLYRRIISIEESYTQERLAILRESFDNNFKLLSEEKEKFYKEISREVAILMNADACSIHLYEVSSDTLKMEDYYSPPKSKLKNLKGKLENFPEVLKENKQNIKDGEVYFYRAEQKDLQVESEVGDYVKSAIYAPLKINSRILGFIGVLGTSPYQFRSHNGQLLLRICVIRLNLRFRPSDNFFLQDV